MNKPSRRKFYILPNREIFSLTKYEYGSARPVPSYTEVIPNQCELKPHKLTPPKCILMPYVYNCTHNLICVQLLRVPLEQTVMSWDREKTDPVNSDRSGSKFSSLVDLKADPKP